MSTQLNPTSPPASLEQFFETNLQPLCNQLETERNRVWSSTWTAAGISGIIALIAMGVIVSSGAPAPFALIPLVVAIVITAVVYSSGAEKYKKLYKSLVIEKLIKFLDPNLQYAPQSHISLGEFAASRLFQRGIDRYSGEDLVSGSLGSTQFRFSELHAEYQTTKNVTDSDGDSRTETEWHTIFRGLFFIADFNKNFQGQTLVLPDTTEGFLGKFGQTLQSWGTAFSDHKLVKLEDPDFEKAFAVYGTDQIEARYLLSPSLMRHLMEFRQRMGGTVYVSFVAPYIYIAVPQTGNLFEPSMRGEALCLADAQNYIQQMQHLTGIISDLDLNTRIWSKQP